MIAFGFNFAQVVVALVFFVLFYVVPIALIVWIVKKLTKR